MADLKVSVAGVEFHNPLIAASGTFGFGREYAEFYPLSALGGISSKGITLKARPGNPAPRIAEALLRERRIHRRDPAFFFRPEVTKLLKKCCKFLCCLL